ncbi:TAP-like protein-domain-containing protein, partial [Mycena rebaudengoi]
PDKGVAGIAILRYPSTSPKSEYRGPILFNPGGPGNSGVAAVRQSGSAFATVFGEQYDIVGFDSRGLSYSTPIVSFFNSAAERNWSPATRNSVFPALNASDEAVPTQWARLQLLGRLAEERDTEHFLQHMTTDNVARDMLSITEAFGFEKLQYWGISYGTILGATFATLIPDKVERMVIDGVVDGEAWLSANLTNSVADTDAALQTFFDGCAAAGPDRCAFHAPTAADIAANLSALTTRIRNEPLAVITNVSYGVFDYSALRNIIFDMLFTPYESFTILAEGLAQLATGNATLLYRLNEVPPFECTKCGAKEPVFHLNKYEGGVATSCGDAVAVNDSVSQVRDFYLNEAMVSSLGGEIFGNWRIVCAGWKIHREGRPVGANTSFPLLVIGNTADPVTPLFWANKTAAAFPHSVLLTQDTPGHTSMSAKSSCTSMHMRRYFQNGTLPEEGTVCSADDELFPS